MRNPVRRKAPGVPAKKTGTRLKRGMATQVMTYPRSGTKRALVEASRDAGLALSSFMIISSLKAAAAIRRCKVADLIPQTELRQYLKNSA